MPKRPLVVASLIVLAAAVSALAYVRFGRATDVAVVSVRRADVAQQVRGPGTVQARTSVALSARVSATVTQILADVGDSVRRGELLVALDDRDLAARRGAVGGQQRTLAHNTEVARASLAKAQADLTLASARRNRDAELLARGFVSLAAVDASEAALRAAAAGVDAARAALAARLAEATTLAQEARIAEVSLTHASLLSPVDGIVTERLVEPGGMVTVGTTILRLVDPRTLWVATRIDETVVARVQLGQSARIRLRTGESVDGRVARIARRSDAATRELEVFVAFDAPPRHFAIDQEAEVTIDTGRRPGLVVPTGALTRDRDGREGVLVVEDGRTRFQAVRTDGADATHVRVASGVHDGQTVVAVATGVRAGQAVRAAVRP